MGAWAYCCQCDCGLDRPTAREVIDGIQYCSRGHGNTPTGTKDELLVDYEERIVELEADVADMKSRLAFLLNHLRLVI